MALQLQLGLPPAYSPRPSLAPPKPPLPFFFLCSFPKISNARNRGLRGTLHFDHRFPLIAAVSSSSTAEAEESAESSGEPRNRLIAQNVPWTSTAEDIRSLFERHGTVLDVELSMYNKIRNRGLAFITMASEEEALAALNSLESYELDGRAIKVDFARSSKKKPIETAVPVKKYTVFVGNLAWRLRSQDLRELFNANENVLSADVIYQTSPRRSAGYGFVCFSSKEAAEAAIATFNGKRVMGRSISLVMKENLTDDAEGKSNEDEQFDEASSEVTADEGLSQQAVPM